MFHDFFGLLELLEEAVDVPTEIVRVERLRLGCHREVDGGEHAPLDVQVQDPRGKWVTVIEDMGMPAGKPKTIAVDLSGKWVSSSQGPADT